MKTTDVVKTAIIGFVAVKALEGTAVAYLAATRGVSVNIDCQNPVYDFINWIGAQLTGEQTFNLGGWTYNTLHGTPNMSTPTTPPGTVIDSSLDLYISDSVFLTDDDSYPFTGFPWQDSADITIQP